jgi:hypothetical protein
MASGTESGLSATGSQPYSSREAERAARDLSPTRLRMTAGRRTNLALLVAFVAALVTGGLAFAAGTAAAVWVAAAHGCAAGCIVLLSPWKSVIVRRGLSRARRGRGASLALTALVVVALGSGLAHSTGLLRDLGAVTAMQVHVGAALASLPLAAWHLTARPTRWHRSDASRRQLLRAGALVGGGALLYAGLEGVLGLARLPGASRRFTGSYETGSGTPERMPVTQWLDDAVPLLNLSEWRLAVRASGDEQTWTLQELTRFDDEATVVLDCTGGWWSEQVWRGARLSRLLDPLDARSLVVTSATGYRRRFPASEAPRLLLATTVAGRPLSAGHGSPARIVAPGRRGFWWVKWVTAIETSPLPWWAQPPFPLS